MKDEKVITKERYPELYEALTKDITPFDKDNFLLPDYNSKEVLSAVADKLIEKGVLK